jgi:PEP-CTERM motif
MKRFVLLAVLLLFTLPAFANSITVFTDGFLPDGEISSGIVMLVAGADPLIAATPVPLTGFSLLIFSATYMNTPPTTFQTWTLTLFNNFGTSTIDFGSGQGCPGTCTTGSITFPIFNPVDLPVEGTLTIQTSTLTETFNFHVASVLPTPEPASVLLLGTGIISIGWRMYRATGRANR